MRAYILVTIVFNQSLSYFSTRYGVISPQYDTVNFCCRPAAIFQLLEPLAMIYRTIGRVHIDFVWCHTSYSPIVEAEINPTAVQYAGIRRAEDRPAVCGIRA